MIGRIIIAGWVFVFGSIVLLAIAPRLVLLISHPELIPFFLIPFVLISLVYGAFLLYRTGLKQSRRK
jgi:hypothetical protein